MFKKILAFFSLLLCFAMASCSSTSEEAIYNSYTYTLNTEAIGCFDLVSPFNEQVVKEIPTFEWEEATNADSYILEVASSDLFSQLEDEVYIKKIGITGTKFNVSANIKYKDKTYYWRVTAKNSKGNKLCQSSYHSFFYAADTGEEVEFPIEYADEWKVHEQGSQASISIDDTNFFSNNKKSLVITFTEECTNQGIPSSDGWMVITSSQEREMYGVDSFYFNFYYSGQNTRVFLRVVDEDNEYYNAEIKVANNVKQTVIMKFDDFTLRTKGGTTIANQVFDYNNIKYVELVFEETFGDGICMLSDLRAVSYASYASMFFSKFNFNDVDKNAIINDVYNFTNTFTEDGSSMTMSYGNINGYGFVKLPVNKFMVTGDAIKMTINYTGSSSSNILIRLIEEDKDRWVYKQSCKTIPEDNTIIIPYNAFTLSEYHGDGSRQFYYLSQLQFGVENSYSAGSITFSSIEIVTLSDYVDNLYYHEVKDDGTIDDFEEYKNNTDIYYQWQTTTSNKDETMSIEKEKSFGANNQSVKLTYKTDMGPACYGVQLTNNVSGYNAISFWANDQSIKNDNAAFGYLKTISAKMIITVYISTGEEYVYVIDSLNKYWTNYTISFADFTLNGVPTSDTLPLESDYVAGVMFGLQYYYYTQTGASYPIYGNSNIVYMDNIRFDHASETSVTELANKISPSSEDPTVAVIDNFDNYTQESLINTWAMKDYDYSGLTLENEGSNSYMKMQYQGNQTSVAYTLQTLFESNVAGKAIMIDLKGDNVATVYINIYVTIASNSYKFRYTLNKVEDSWNTYTIGIDLFTKVEGTGNLSLASKYVPNITSISFGIVNSVNNSISYVEVDNIRISSSAAYSTNTKTPIGG